MQHRQYDIDRLIYTQTAKPDVLRQSMPGGVEVRRSALPLGLTKPAAAAAAAAAIALLAGAAVAFANMMAPEPSPCLQPDTAGGDPCTTPVELGACAALRADLSEHIPPQSTTHRLPTHHTNILASLA